MAKQVKSLKKQIKARLKKIAKHEGKLAKLKKKLKKVFINQNTDTVTMPVAIINLTKLVHKSNRYEHQTKFIIW